MQFSKYALYISFEFQVSIELLCGGELRSFHLISNTILGTLHWANSIVSISKS